MKQFLLDQILAGNLILALPIAAVAGLISFASPCVIPLVPGYLTYAAGFSKSRGKLLLASLLFIGGFASLFVAYGALFGGIGRSITIHQSLITRVLGVFTILMGLIFMGGIKWMRTFKVNYVAKSGLLSAPVLGFMFGLGWTPCIGPALAAVQSLAIESASASRGAALSVAYCFGLGVPFILTGIFLDRSAAVRKFLSRNGEKIAFIGGVLLIGIGILQITGGWDYLMASLRASISGFEPVL